MPHSSPTAVLLAFALTIFGPLAGAAVVVTNTSDGSGGCAATGLGPCTLRDAITFTNAHGGGAINFNIPGAGVQTIAPLSPLPAVTGATMIDGYSQPGTSMNTAPIQNGTNAVVLIELDNTHNGGGGLVVTGDGSIVQGLVSNRSIGPGMTISGKNVQVLGNFIGTNPSGTAPGPGNGGDGIAVGSTGDIIGGTTDAARNLISGNADAGIRISGAGVLNAVVSNNLIGTNAAGTAALPNLAQGVVISGQGHLVGLGATSLGNVISGNVASGVLVATALVSATIAGNNIGANAAGTAPLGNGTGGVTDGITVNSSFVLIGGATAAEGNVIGGSAVNGILVNGNSNQILNNRIGVLPNGGANGNANAGISIHPFSNNNKIGDIGEGNTITNSGGNGVEIQGAGVTGGTGNEISSNSIFGNGGLGIKLGNGVSPLPNDLGDADTGPNHLQNYPVITSAAVSGGLLVLSGTLNSLPNHVFTISVYSSVTCDPSGNGEGQTFLGTGLLMSDGSGNLSFNGSTVIPPGQLAITATATDNVDMSTSEFSHCFTAIGPPFLMRVQAGSGQTTRVATPFANALVVLVLDANLTPVPNAVVIWTAPTQGASATFSAPSSVTNASGLATISATASAIAGTYDVVAQAGAASANVALTNTTTISAGNTCSGNAATNADLVEQYYAAILRRASDAGGKAFWLGEADRLCALGVDPKQTFFLLANAFYNSPEYLAFNRDNNGFVTDQYITFFGRLPDAGGQNYWVGQLVAGMTRNNVMGSFLFSPEFTTTMNSVFPGRTARAETYLAMNLYGGFLRRLADSSGYMFWDGQFRSAECSAGPASVVTATIDAVSSQFLTSAEYVARATSNSQFVDDLYYAMLQRGGDLAGFNFWVGQLNAGVTRDQLRQQFLTSPEMQAQTAAIAAQGCLP